MNNISEVTDRLASNETGMEPWLWMPLLKLLALGDPVDVSDLAAATGRAGEEVRTALKAMGDTEYDGSGRIIGQGLTQRPTQHRFEVNGEQLYTWCALDTLIFPTLLGASARIESSHQATGTPVRVAVTAMGVTSVEPATAVVSLVNPEDISSVRSSFCNQVHFFASPDDAAPWLETHPGGTIMPVKEAYELGSSMAEKMLTHTPGPATDQVSNGVQKLRLLNQPTTHHYPPDHHWQLEGLHGFSTGAGGGPGPVRDVDEGPERAGKDPLNLKEKFS